MQLAGVTGSAAAAAADANGMEVDGQQQPAASTSGRKLFVGSQELGYSRPHMEVGEGGWVGGWCGWLVWVWVAGWLDERVGG